MKLKKKAAINSGKIKSVYKWWLLFPCIFIYAIFFILPAIMGMIMSFFNVRTFNISDMTFAGLQNYINVFSDSYLSISIKNSFIFAFITTICKVGFGMLLAVFLNNKLKTTNFLRTVYFLPAILSSVAIGPVFSAMMHPTNGIINKFFRAVHLDFLAQNWLTDPKIAIYSLAFIEILKWTGFTMVILLAGLQSIDASYYEAAEIDGATPWKKFWKITFPLIMPAFTNALVVNLIGGLKAFDIVQAVTQGGQALYRSVWDTCV